MVLEHVLQSDRTLLAAISASHRVSGLAASSAAADGCTWGAPTLAVAAGTATPDVLPYQDPAGAPAAKLALQPHLQARSSDANSPSMSADSLTSSTISTPQVSCLPACSQSSTAMSFGQAHVLLAAPLHAQLPSPVIACFIVACLACCCGAELSATEQRIPVQHGWCTCMVSYVCRSCVLWHRSYTSCTARRRPQSWTMAHLRLWWTTRLPPGSPYVLPGSGTLKH